MLLGNIKDVAIWGAGKQGKKAFFKLRKYFNIICFFDNAIDKRGEVVIENIRVESFNKQNYYIIVATDFWQDISVQLQKEKLRLIDDFLPMDFWMCKNVHLHNMLKVFEIEDIIRYLKLVEKFKKIALVYGNCQAEIISNMLESNITFNNDFLLLRVPLVHLYKDKVQIKKIFYDRIIKEVDLFIYQNVGYENGYFPELASEAICNQLKETCKKVRILNLYFDGYFVQYDQSLKGKFALNTEKFLFPYVDRYIDRFVREKYKVDNILARISDVNFISPEKIFEKCERSIKELKKREESADIKITKYIEENFRITQLFYTRNHPSMQLIDLYVNRILDFLGYKENLEMKESVMYMHYGYAMKNCDWPLYPSVICVLGLKSYEKFLYIYTMIDNQLYTFESFMREYLERCYFYY